MKKQSGWNVTVEATLSVTWHVSAYTEQEAIDLVKEFASRPSRYSLANGKGFRVTKVEKSDKHASLYHP